MFRFKCNKYSIIDENDKESIILESIWRCLKNYDKEKSNAKLTTMISKYIDTMCKNYVKLQSLDKRKINQSNITSLFSQFENTDFLEKNNEDTAYNEIELRLLIEQLSLSHIEKAVCNGIIEGYNTCDIAKQLNVSNSYICHIKKGLKRKLKEAFFI